jgi:hypothetical protein
MIGSERYPTDNVRLQIHFPENIGKPVTSVTYGQWSQSRNVGIWDIGMLPLDRALNFSATVNSTTAVIEQIRY